MRWEPGDEIERTRFFQRVMYGPDLDSCHLWVGALGDDGYGRFWIARDGHQIVVRPHRYALAMELERGLDDNVVAMHRRCDNPLCVNTGDGDAFAAHVVLTSAAENMADMGRKGRGGGRRLWFDADRAERARRSRAVREAVLRYGWDQHAIETALYDGAQGTLW
ncbi:hypothetical protein L612_002000000190 [Rhodococcus rhodochrous J38]|nr:hypothetical protein L612_002000000190 [Rhodococcus rhodochrous J38]